MAAAAARWGAETVPSGFSVRGAGGLRSGTRETRRAPRGLCEKHRISGFGQRVRPAEALPVLVLGPVFKTGGR